MQDTGEPLRGRLRALQHINKKEITVNSDRKIIAQTMGEEGVRIMPVREMGFDSERARS